MGHKQRSAAWGVATMVAASVLAPMPTLAQGRGGGDVQPFTLDLLVQDPMDRQAGVIAQDLVRIANEVSGGTITIVPTFDGEDVASAVRAGDVDLGILPSRDWDAQGVTSFDALEAPFLVDDDALAEAIATSDIATGLMSGLDAVGITGLAIWPEDMRHLFAFDKSGRVFDTPEAVKDAVVLVVAGEPAQALITTLGGHVYQEGVATDSLTGDRNADAESGALAGGALGLWGAGLPTYDVTVAGDLPVFAKFQTLVANRDALAGLTDAQRDLLDQVVSATLPAALDRHFAEPDLALGLCALGATITEIGPDAIAAFRAAAQPLTDELMADPVTGRLMADIAALDQATPDALSAGTCFPPGAPGSSALPGGFVGDRLPPDGTYRTTMTADELMGLGASRNYASINAGTWTWTFADGMWSATHDVRDERCAGTYGVVEGGVGFVTLESRGCGMDYVLLWQQGDDGLMFRLVGLRSSDPQALKDEGLFLERAWNRIGDASDLGFIGDRLPPNGTWRIQHTAEELTDRGVSRDFASINAGTWTWTLEDGTWRLTHDVRSEHCSGTAVVVDGVIRLATPGAGNTCNLDGDIRWRLDDAGQLYLNWVADTFAPGNPAVLRDNDFLVGGPWTPVQQ